MPAQSKLELLLALRNKIKTGLTKARNQLKSKLAGMKNDLKDFRQSHVNAFATMKDQIPGLGSAMSLLGNPYAIATAGIVALSAAAYKGVQAAGHFNHQFLELQNLNLDKSNAQIGKLNDNILNIALKEGFDSTKTAQGFYDVQSALGVYGQEVENIVTKVGRFSIATKADFTDSINSTTKAMKAFGFDSRRLDEYLSSNAKTVQVGITTFDELAKVQTEYAGTAAAAGQDFNTANKIFAAFTAIAKDGRIAANMTKTAFAGLTMKPTIKGLRAVGVDMFDAKGNMKDMFAVIQELIPTINSMSDTEFLAFRNAIGGPEGLQSLFNQLRTSGTDLLDTFRAFDESTFSIDKALANAKGDFNTLSQILGNQINNLMIRLGQAILPPIIRGIHLMSEGIKKTFNFVNTHKKTFLAIWTGIKAGVLAAASAFLVMKAGMIASFVANKVLIGGLQALRVAIFNIPIVGWVALAVAALVTMYQRFDKFRAVIDGIANIFVEMLPLFKAVGNLMVGIFTGNAMKIADSFRNIKKEWKNFSFTEAYNRGYDNSLAESRKKALEEDALNTDTSTDNNGLDTNLQPDTSTSEQGTHVGSAQQVKSIIVNVEAVHKGDNIIRKSSIEDADTMTIEQWEELMDEHGLRLLRNFNRLA